MKWYDSLEFVLFLLSESIGLGNDGNDIDARCYTSHKVKIKLLQSQDGWLQKVQQRMNPMLFELGIAMDTNFLFKVFMHGSFQVLQQSLCPIEE